MCSQVWGLVSQCFPNLPDQERLTLRNCFKVTWGGAWNLLTPPREFASDRLTSDICQPSSSGY